MFPASKKHQDGCVVAVAEGTSVADVHAQRVVASPMPDSLTFCLPNSKCMPPLPVGMEGVPLDRWNMFWIKANETLSSLRRKCRVSEWLVFLVFFVFMIALISVVDLVEPVFVAILVVLMAVSCIGYCAYVCRQARRKHALEIEAIKALCQEEERAIFQHLSWSLYAEPAQSGSEAGPNVSIIFRRVNPSAVVLSRSKTDTADEEVV